MISERSLSNLKYVKNRLYTSIDEDRADRLNQPAIISSEFDILRKLDFQNVIDNFVQIIKNQEKFRHIVLIT